MKLSTKDCIARKEHKKGRQPQALSDLDNSNET